MPAPLALLLAAGVLAAGSGLVALPFQRAGRAADRIAAAFLTLAAALGVAAIGTAGGIGGEFDAAWFLPFGRFTIALDGLSSAFLIPALVLPSVSSWYGTGYCPATARPVCARRIRIALGGLVAAMTLLLLARDAVLFLIAFEGMTLAAFFLVTADDCDEEVRRAGWWYFCASHLSLLTLYCAFLLLRTHVGDFSLAPGAAAALGRGAALLVFLLTLIGFAIKAGLMPFHFWLPLAHAAAPSHVSAVLSGVVIKMGVYGVARVATVLPAPTRGQGVALLALGAVSGVAGVACAIGQHDIKRLLAYHSIENIGIIFMGLGFASLGRWAGHAELAALGMACAVMHVWNHGLFKSLLFLSAGAVVHATGTRELDRLHGLRREMPWSAGLFLIGAVAICGLPPLNGFVSEFFLYSGSLRGVGGGLAPAALAAPVLAAIGALACACFLKVYGTVFLGAPTTEEAARAHECPWSMRAPMLVLACACVVLGVAPSLVFPLLDAAAESLWGGPRLSTLGLPFGAIAAVAAATLAGASLLWLALRRRRARLPAEPTWDCGFSRPVPRAQYTASSFGQALVRLTAPLLRPVRHARLPDRPLAQPSSFSTHVHDSVLETLGGRLSGVARRLAAWRRRGSGSLQGYLLLVVTVTMLLMAAVSPLPGMLAAWLVG